MRLSLLSSLQCSGHIIDMRPGHQRHALGLGVLHEAAHFSVVYALIGHHGHGANPVALTPPNQERPVGRPAPKGVGVVGGHPHISAVAVAACSVPDRNYKADHGIIAAFHVSLKCLLCRVEALL